MGGKGREGEEKGEKEGKREEEGGGRKEGANVASWLLGGWTPLTGFYAGTNFTA